MVGGTATHEDSGGVAARRAASRGVRPWRRLRQRRPRGRRARGRLRDRDPKAGPARSRCATACCATTAARGARPSPTPPTPPAPWPGSCRPCRAHMVARGALLRARGATRDLVGRVVVCSTASPRAALAVASRRTDAGEVRRARGRARVASARRRSRPVAGSGPGPPRWPRRAATRSGVCRSVAPAELHVRTRAGADERGQPGQQRPLRCASRRTRPVLSLRPAARSPSRRPCCRTRPSRRRPRSMGMVGEQDPERTGRTRSRAARQILRAMTQSRPARSRGQPCRGCHPSGDLGQPAAVAAVAPAGTCSRSPSSSR